MQGEQATFDAFDLQEKMAGHIVDTLIGFTCIENGYMNLSPGELSDYLAFLQIQTLKVTVYLNELSHVLERDSDWIESVFDAYAREMEHYVYRHGINESASRKSDEIARSIDLPKLCASKIANTYIEIAQDHTDALGSLILDPNVDDQTALGYENDVYKLDNRCTALALYLNSTPQNLDVLASNLPWFNIAVPNGGLPKVYANYENIAVFGYALGASIQEGYTFDDVQDKLDYLPKDLCSYLEVLMDKLPEIVDDIENVYVEKMGPEQYLDIDIDDPSDFSPFRDPASHWCASKRVAALRHELRTVSISIDDLKQMSSDRPYDPRLSLN